MIIQIKFKHRNHLVFLEMFSVQIAIFQNLIIPYSSFIASTNLNLLKLNWEGLISNLISIKILFSKKKFSGKFLLSFFFLKTLNRLVPMVHLYVCSRLVPSLLSYDLCVREVTMNIFYINKLISDVIVFWIQKI